MIGVVTYWWELDGGMRSRMSRIVIGIILLFSRYTISHRVASELNPLRCATRLTISDSQSESGL